MIESFPRDTLRAFRFVRAAFDADTGVARLVYAFDDADGQVGPELTETVTIPGAPFVLDEARRGWTCASGSVSPSPIAP